MAWKRVGVKQIWEYGSAAGWKMKPRRKWGGSSQGGNSRCRIDAEDIDLIINAFRYGQFRTGAPGRRTVTPAAIGLESSGILL